MLKKFGSALQTFVAKPSAPITGIPCSSRYCPTDPSELGSSRMAATTLSLTNFLTMAMAFTGSPPVSCTSISTGCPPIPPVSLTQSAHAVATSPLGAMACEPRPDEEIARPILIGDPVGCGATEVEAVVDVAGE